MNTSLLCSKQKRMLILISFFLYKTQRMSSDQGYWFFFQLFIFKVIKFLILESFFSLSVCWSGWEKKIKSVVLCGMNPSVYLTLMRLRITCKVNEREKRFVESWIGSGSSFTLIYFLWCELKKYWVNGSLTVDLHTF